MTFSWVSLHSNPLFIRFSQKRRNNHPCFSLNRFNQKGDSVWSYGILKGSGIAKRNDLKPPGVNGPNPSVDPSSVLNPNITKNILMGINLAL